MMRARLRERHRRRRPSAIGTTARCSRSIRRTSRRGVARAHLPRSERYAELSQVLQTEGDILEDCPRRRARSSRPRAIEEDVLERTSSDRRLPPHPRARQEDLRAIDALIKLYLGLTRGGGPARSSTSRRPTSSPTPTRRSASTTRSAPSTSVSSATCRAPSTPTSACSSSTRRTCRRSAASTSSTRLRENWPELLSVLQQEAELAAIRPRDQLPVPHRRALREAPRRRGARDRALSRLLAADAGPRADPRGARGHQGRPARGARCGARARAHLRRAGEWQRLDQRARGAGRAAEDAFQRVELLHRIARLTRRCSATTRGVRDVRPRRPRRQSPTRTRSATSSGSRRGRRGPTWPRSTTAARQASARAAGALRRARAAPRADLRGAARGRRQRDRALPPGARGRPENQWRDPLPRPALQQTERWAELAPCSPARPRSGQSPTRSRVQVPPRPGAPARLNDVPRPSRRTARSSRGARARRRSRRSRGSSPTACSQLEIGEILEPLYQGRASGRSSAACSRPSSRTRRSATGASRCTTASRSSEEKLMAPTARSASTCAPSRSTPPTSARSRRCERSRRRPTAAGSRSPTRTPTCSQLHATRRCRRRSASASRASSRRSSATSRTPRRPTATCSASSRSTPRRSLQLDRIYTSLEQWPELAQVLEQRVLATKDPTSSSSSTRARPGLRGAARASARRRDRALPPHLRRARPPNEQAILALERIYASEGRGRS
jgi:hypothetical protein